MLTNGDLKAIKEVVSDELIKELHPLKKDIRKLRKDLNVISKAFDRDLINTIHRVDRIEGHLGLPPIQVN